MDSNTSQNSEEQPISKPTAVDEVYDLSQFGIDDSDLIPTGLKVGEKAPDFYTQDIDGKEISLGALLKTGPLVLQFYRGAWCPVCERYYSSILDSIPFINEVGASFLLITPELPENANAFRKNLKITHSVIADLDHRIMRDYDVLFKVNPEYDSMILEALQTNISKHNGKDEAYLPVPATYIIDQKKNIRFVQFNYDYNKRASVKGILKELSFVNQ